LYGSARLGMYLPEKIVTSGSTDSKQREVGYLGKQVFELSNHLGNVLVTITDKKLQVSLNTSSTAYFEADVQTVQDYYAGGMLMPGRSFSIGSSYAFRYNGKRKDDDISGEGNTYDYGSRIYNPRIVTWFSVDPLQKKYPSESPYLFNGANPIYFVDPDGRDRISYIRTIGVDGTVLLKMQVTKGYYKAIYNATYNTGGYYTKNDYAVYETHDLRSGKDVVSRSTQTLYGADHATEVGVGTYLKIKVLGFDGAVLPQLMVFGAGTSDPGFGSKADPNSPITPINYATFESMMSLVTLGMKVPDLKGTDPKKIPELLDKYRKLKMFERENDEKREPNSTVCSMCADVPHPIDGIDGYKTGKNGEVTDTIRKNNKTGKIDTIPTKKDN